jgi:hypothetical protein
MTIQTKEKGVVQRFLAARFLHPRWASRSTTMQAVLQGSVSGALVRSAASPLVVVPRALVEEPWRYGTTSPRRIA